MHFHTLYTIFLTTTFTLSNCCYAICFAECWQPEQYTRPSFYDIRDHLEQIRTTEFVVQDSFDAIQADWKDEIQEMFDELRDREKVRAES